jgi:transcription termination factor Rho
MEKSGTRKEELLLSTEEQKRIWVLRRVLSEMPNIEAMELLRDRISRSKSNEDFLRTMNLNA